jgi:hypothetical protein
MYLLIVVQERGAAQRTGANGGRVSASAQSPLPRAVLGPQLWNAVVPVHACTSHVHLPVGMIGQSFCLLDATSGE